MLKFGCASVIILAVIVGIVAAFGLGQPGGSPQLSLEYVRPGERADRHSGFVVRFSNTSDAKIVNPQIEVIANVGNQDWTCQGYADPTSGVPRTDPMDVLGSPLVIAAGQEMAVTIYCRMPEAPLDAARLRLR